jgi:hypothetical protein
VEYKAGGGGINSIDVLKLTYQDVKECIEDDTS